MKICRAALPLAWLYGTGVWIRNRLFDAGILPSRKFDLPVVSIGNLTVGGTGKTPHTEYLANLLRQEFTVAILSRGYKRTSKGFHIVDPGCGTDLAGDEPHQMAHKFFDVVVAVDKNRRNGIKRLTDGSITPTPQVVLLDDAYQHRYVKPGLSLLLTDYNRPFYDDMLLPAGRLREPISEKRRADLFIVTKCPDDLNTEKREEIRQRINPQRGQEVYFTRIIYGKLQPMFFIRHELELSSLHDKMVLLLTGIASPEPIRKKIATYAERVITATYPDHHDFSDADFRTIEKSFKSLPEEKRLIVTTEKDASRLMGNNDLPNDLKPLIYVLPIEVEFLDDAESFNHKIISYVRENTRNRLFPEK